MVSWFGWRENTRNTRDACTIVLCTVLALGIFVFDLETTADDVSVGFAYDGVVLLTILVRTRRIYFWYAAATSALVAIGCFFPLPAPEQAPVFFANRALAIMSLWLIATVIHYRTRSEAMLRALLATSESASQSKSRFLATMSHELRAPLTGILGFSEIIKSEMLGPLGNGRYVDYAGYIHESGEHMLSLINDVLDIAKIEAGRMEIDQEWLNVATLLEYVTDVTATRAEGKGLTLISDCPATLQLHADVRAVKQMALNLVSNAIKFTPAGGCITLSAAAAANGGVRLAVIDTGVGMSNETIGRLLRPFEQADNRYTVAEKGSGLGLSLVKGLMELHGGVIAIDSQAGRGSTFTLHFPPAPGPGPGGRAATSAAPGRAGTAPS